MHSNTMRCAFLGMVAATCALCLTLKLAGVTPEPSLDYRDLASHLVTRGAMSTQGQVHYQTYHFRLPTVSVDALYALLAQSQVAPDPELISSVEEWLGENLPASREVWTGTCSYMDGEWLDRKGRLSQVDTAKAQLEHYAHDSGIAATPLVQEIVHHADAFVTTIVEDGNVVTQKPTTIHQHPLVPLDISLASWQDAIDLGANVPGQSIEASEDGDYRTITYVNTMADESWHAVAYMFCSDLDWAPAELRSYDASGTDTRIVYGYVPSVAQAMYRPAVVVKAHIVGDDEVDVTLWIIENWTNTCDLSDLALRLPPIHLSIDFMDSIDDPSVEIREPAYLAEVQGCEKMPVTLLNVSLSLGTEDIEADFDTDGYVTFDDFEAASDVFAGNAHE